MSDYKKTTIVVWTNDDLSLPTRESFEKWVSLYTRKNQVYIEKFNVDSFPDNHEAVTNDVRKALGETLYVIVCDKCEETFLCYWGEDGYTYLAQAKNFTAEQKQQLEPSLKLIFGEKARFVKLY